MEQLEKLLDIKLFKNISLTELKHMLQCLNAFEKNYHKGEFIAIADNEIHYIGIILKGSVAMVKEDLWGNRAMLVIISRGEVLGETFAAMNQVTACVSFQSMENTTILFLSFRKVMHTCSIRCVFHHKLIENMVEIIAYKNHSLMEKLEITLKKTLREKILAFLSIQAQKKKSDYFELDMGRVQLAEYLCANRSALTRELTYMRKDGLIDFDKNTFRIINKK